MNFTTAFNQPDSRRPAGVAGQGFNYVKLAAPMPSDRDRYRGCLLGLACGDAVGATAEFQARGTFPPISDMVGGGPFGLESGQWTDDTSMALCLAASLAQCAGFDARDQMDRFCQWQTFGYMSSTGDCFDIGTTVRSALRHYRETGNPFAGDTHPRTAGNGALMRLAPIPMYFRDWDDQQFLHYCAESTRTTHAAQEAIDCSKLFGWQIRVALQGGSKADICHARLPVNLCASVASLADGAYIGTSSDQVRGTGYCVESLEAALWCFWHSDSYESAVLLATNLGDDADTTAAICGQLAGAFYGLQAVPSRWLAKISSAVEIQHLADALQRMANR